MKDFRTLKMLDLFKMSFEKFGVNYLQLRKILSIKLTLDQRKTPTIFNQQNKKKRESGFVQSLWIYTLFGLMLIPFIGFGKSYFFQMSIFFGIVMFLVMTSMIADFSSVLLDLRDKNILGFRPIDKRTISIAKSIHVCIYLFFLTASITAIPLIVGLIQHGVLFFLFSLIELILLNLFIVMMTAIVYYFILRFFDGEKLKDMINYVQIGLTIAITVGYQLMVRSFSLINLDVAFTPKWWQFFIPPIWFAAPFEMFIGNDFDPYLIIFSLMALILPFIAIILYYRMLPSFERNLQKLAISSGKRKKSYRSWKNWLINILCWSKEEKVFFQFSNNMMRNEREFRLKVYPSLGFSLIFPFVFMLNELQNSSFKELAASKWFLSIYVCLMIIPNAINMLSYSGNYKGSWIYGVIPLKSMASLKSAVLKAFLVKLFLPVYLILSAIFIAIFGIKILPDIFIVLLSAILYTVICSSLMEGSLPFSESFETAQQTNGVKMVPYLFINALLWGVHYASTFIPFGALIYIILLIGVIFFTWRSVFKNGLVFSK